MISASIETVIDEPVSNQWMRRTFPRGRFATIDGGRHQLLNECDELREQVLEIIRDELGG
ncbi:MAG: alpha-beta hydrolase superfamily lysophospholipase [Verrucomicrobiales bacterium]